MPKKWHPILSIIEIQTLICHFIKDKIRTVLQNQDTSDGNDAAPGTSKDTGLVNSNTRKRKQQDDTKGVDKESRKKKQTRQSRKGKSPLHTA